MTSQDISGGDGPQPAKTWPRRAFLGAGALSVAGLVTANELGGFSRAASFLSDAAFAAAPPKAWNVPEAAYLRKWGLAPPGPCESLGDSECRTGVTTGLRNQIGGLSVPGLGIPLGGVGAGAFHYNLFGTFGPWNMGGSQSSSFWEMRTLPQAAFHVREHVEGATGAATVKTLATRHDNVAPQRNFGGVLPAWNQLSPGDGTYSALYPFGWTTYNVFESDVSIRFWSPIIAEEDERTAMPVAFFDVHLANPTAKAIDVSVMFTFPNAAPHSSGTIRTGFYSQFQKDRSGVAGVTLGANDPSNTPDAVRSEWTIAALPERDQRLSYATSWNGDATGPSAGSDIYTAFSSTGELPNRALDSSHSAGALAVATRLAAGQETTVRFALAWDFPQVYYDGGGRRGRCSRHLDASVHAVPRRNRNRQQRLHRRLVSARAGLQHRHTGADTPRRLIGRGATVVETDCRQQPVPAVAQ